MQRTRAEDGDLLQTKQREKIDEDGLSQRKVDLTSTAGQDFVQRAGKLNNTGLPDQLKAGIEKLSGYSMDDVKVHYHSDKPAQLQALAYTQGTDIYVAPGQENNLPHEAWHVVQQKQGRVQPTMQLQGVHVNDDAELEKEADMKGGQTLQMLDTDVHPFASAVGSSTKTIQMRLQLISAVANLYRDNRGGAYTLRWLGGNYYQVVNDGFVVLHTDADRYLMAGNNIYWDPVTGGAFKHLGGRCYLSMSQTTFVYSQGYYHPVPIVAHPELRDFLDRVWKLRDKVLKQWPINRALHLIYSEVYSKEGQNTKKVPEHKSPTIHKLVTFSLGKRAQIQFGCLIPLEQPTVVFDIQELYNMMTGFLDPQIKYAAYMGLSSGYYYFTINSEVKPNARIILNVAPDEVPGALDKLWPIVSASPLVQGMKAGGPIAAAQKLDSIIIYVNKEDGFRMLLTNIQHAGIPTVDLLPELVVRQSEGIGTADEPRKLDDKFISFGQKRVILAYMALKRADSQEMMRILGATYFAQAGIDVVNPSQEIGGLTNPGIGTEFRYLLALMNARP